MRTLIVAIKMTIVLTVLLGLIYPIAMTGICGVLLHTQAQGSLVERNGQVIGSSLIGQKFAAPGYFHSRPSSAGDKGYDASASSGSNLGPTNKALIEAVKSRLKGVLEENPGTSPAQVPIDLVTTSGSGLDPEISPAAAQLQVPRVAKARGISEDQVGKLVEQSTRGRWMGVLGEPGVNVLQLNLALDQAAPIQRQASK
ncbi:MAG TPA: potassium-transporting ATPase subunit KdpC [Candidatus Binataceae bacterium]|nr:potassium-transporting ATPase subunit KdpC [Candidatus Binataceae bacterium]